MNSHLTINKATPMFTARTNITAPSSLLTKEQITQLSAIGNKIGDSKSFIKLTLSPHSMNKDVYHIEKEYSLVKAKKSTQAASGIFLLKKNEPFAMVKKILSQIDSAYKKL